MVLGMDLSMEKVSALLMKEEISTEPLTARRCAF